MSLIKSVPYQAGGIFFCRRSQEKIKGLKVCSLFRYAHWYLTVFQRYDKGGGLVERVRIGVGGSFDDFFPRSLGGPFSASSLEVLDPAIMTEQFSQLPNVDVDLIVADLL